METGRQDTPDAPEDTPPDAVDSDLRRTKPATVWLVVALVIIAVAAALSSAVHTYRIEQRRRALRTAEALPESRRAPEAVGSEDADLKIEACLGPCIEPVFDCFAECAEAWPDKVRAEFIPYLGPEGLKFVNDHGEELACIFFNGKNRFTLGEGDSSREVHLSGAPGEGYGMGDLAEVLRMQMEELYGELPPDFQERVAAFDECIVSPEQEGAE